jgi:hypothetical protein
VVVVLAIPKLDAVFVDVFLTDGTGLRRIGGGRRDQCILDLLGTWNDRNRLFPIHGDLKRHLNGRLARRLRRLRQVLQKFLHGLPHLDVIVGHPKGIPTVGMSKEHTEKSFIPSGKLSKGVDLLH